MTGSREMLAHWRPRLSELECDSMHRVGIRLRADKGLSQLKTNETDLVAFHEEIPVLGIPSLLPLLPPPPPPPPRKEETGAIYMPHHEVLIDEESVRILAI